MALKPIGSVPPRPVGDLAGIERNAKGDLDAVVERGYLRVLVAPSRTHFERNNGHVSGRSVDVGAALEESLNRDAPRKVSIVFIDTPEDALIPDLLAGKGDVAANLLLTFERDDQVAFAKPVTTGIRELVVTGPNEPHVVSLEDVGGRKIHVRASSDHYASLVRLNAQLKKIDRRPARIVIAPRTQSDEQLLDLVNAGKIPATIAYDYVYDACCSKLTGLKTNRDVAVSQDGTLAWVARKDAPKLLAFLNEFFSTHALREGTP
jgi:membrane-bound lytic murein transglycosylase MltF